MRILDIVPGTSVDGPGLRTSIYFAGCRHNCPGCHNPQSWDFNAGQEMSVDEVIAEIEKHGFNVTFTGGDPLYHLSSDQVFNREGNLLTPQLNEIPELLRLAAELRKRDYTIWCYTGFTYEDVAADPRMSTLLPYLEVMVDGPFILSQRNISLQFRGSSNQRLIDIPATSASAKLTFWKETF